MSNKAQRVVYATLFLSVAICVASAVSPATPAVYPPPAPQASVSLHLTLGNPSGATTSTGNKDNFLLVKPQYVLSYNDDRGAPNWVSWHLQKSDIGKVDRLNNFHPETALPTGFKRVVPADYTGTGFDRGHMCNSKDRTKTKTDNSETFSMANMEPQTKELNEQVWKRLEDYSRTLVDQGNELYITAGCYGDAKTIGRANKVTVPERCWKVIVVLKQQNGDDISRVDENTRVITVDMPNKNGIKRDPWQKYIVTVRDVEEKTGYDLLSEVPKGVQDAIETKRDTGRAPATRRASGGRGQR